MTQELGRTKWFAARFRTGIALGSIIAGGCATEHYYEHRQQADYPSDAVVPESVGPPRSLPMFEGDTGRVATWFDLIEGLEWADVILIGETHSDHAAHFVEAAIVEDALAGHPGAVVSMEMFERDQQAIVDDYLAGRIDLPTFIEQAKTRRWEFKKETPSMTWENSYQLVVDAAKRAGARVIAANSPREFVRMARKEGYDALRALPPEKQELFDVPAHLDEGAYRQRFNETMADTKLAPGERRDEFDAGFHAQQVWDATMAASIANALDDGAPKVIHIAGCFHVEWRGGIAGQLRFLKPCARILIVTVVDEDRRELAESDRGRADIVMYSAKEFVQPTTPEEPTKIEAAPTPTGKEPVPGEPVGEPKKES